MRAIFGFATLIIAGYLASHYFRRISGRKKSFDAFFTSGFFFIFIGVLFGPKFLDVLSYPVIRQLDPFIYLALGWIGFIVGIQFEARLLRYVPRRLFVLAQLESLVSILALLACLLGLLGWLSGVLKASAFDVWTGAIILTACGAISSSLTIHYYVRTASSAAKKILRPLEFLVSLHVFIPLIGVAILFSFFHIDQEHGAHFSGWVWMAIHLIAGGLLGLMMFYLLRPRLTENERLLLILGGVTFSAGVAGYLHISPIAICFIAGIVFANLPGFNHVLMEVILRHAERPLYLIMLILAGSLWDFGVPYAWGFLLLYVAIRLAAKASAFHTLSAAEPALGLRWPLLGGFLAQGPLAIALVVGYEQRYSSPFLPYIVTAILAGAIVNEIFAGRFLRAAFPPSAPDVSNKVAADGIDDEMLKQ